MPANPPIRVTVELKGDPALLDVIKQILAAAGIGTSPAATSSVPAEQPATSSVPQPAASHIAPAPAAPTVTTVSGVLLENSDVPILSAPAPAPAPAAPTAPTAPATQPIAPAPAPSAPAPAPAADTAPPAAPAPAAPAPAGQVTPTGNPALMAVRDVALALAQAKGRDAVVQLLGQFGATTIAALPEASFDAFKAAAEQARVAG